jgi:hypothetical protein
MKDNFVNKLIISLFHTTLIIVINLYNIVKTIYILERMERVSNDAREQQKDRSGGFSQIIKSFLNNYEGQYFMQLFKYNKLFDRQ